MRRKCSESRRMILLRSSRLKLYGIGGITGLSLCGLVLAFYVFAGRPVTVPSFAKVRESYTKSDAILRDRGGIVIHELRVDLKGRSLEWVPLSKISPPCVAAVLQSEDRRFYAHRGVDVRAIGHAFFQNQVFRAKRGASTLTMQLASMIDKRLKPESRRRTWQEKVRQVKAALAIERTWSKEEILEAYLNLVSFRGELQGIASAARGLFNKEPEGLDHMESVILAALIRAPAANISTIAQRADLLSKALKTGIQQDQLKARIEETLLRPYSMKPRVALAPHAAHLLLDAAHREVQCTIDGALQALATDLLREQLTLLKAQNVNDGALIVVENRTGEIRAYVGNGGLQSSALWVDGVRAKRQAGSTLKPFLYALAIDTHVITAASLINDSPVEVTTARGIYKPDNYDNTFKGPVPVRTALASSLNVPAVRVLMLAGIDDFMGKLRELGFSDLRDGEYYGFSLALGTLDVSLFELTNAYRTLANGGTMGSLTFIPSGNLPVSLHKGATKGAAQASDLRKKRIFSREASFIISHILSDREARSLTFGYENPLSTRFWVAAKTGTSKDMRDNWCIGFSDQYTVGVWVGNFSGTSMWNVSGVSGAAPIWHGIMAYLHRNRPGAPQPVPQGRLVHAEVGGNGGPAKQEWFIKGTEPLSIEARPAARGRPRILYPPQDLFIALDPDIPFPQQKVFFEASAPGRQVAWVLNNEVVGKDNLYGWSPIAGTYTLKLVDHENHLLDQVSFTVKE
ncbi:MAG: penicillin-binding protein 1C [Syntrophus sp. (in: bacteria)]|nr:penicillin-binding protein 1C [Syntrophus sp. (in: bacteria)]